MMLNNSKLVVSVITKLAPKLSPEWPPKYLFIKLGIDTEDVKPENKQYINKKVLDMFKLVKDRKSIIPVKTIITDGIISLDRPFQCSWWMDFDSLLKMYSYFSIAKICENLPQKAAKGKAKGA